MITILGPTATGKTSFAVYVAAQLNGEIISADSRQVYQGMDIGTGKDLSEYEYQGRQIPHHLIDIVEAGYEYSVFEFQRDFLKAYEQIEQNGTFPILCGGTGMYIESVLKGYKLINVPENELLREDLELKSDLELEEILENFKALHNTTDVSDRDRLLRAIEIQTYYDENPDLDTSFPEINTIILGLDFDRRVVRSRITDRLEERLKGGMIDEVEDLLAQGVSAEKLKFYGLEYRFVTQYLSDEISYDEMSRRLNTAIHQFAKRQMTWFRRMEKQGFEIHWLNGNLTHEQKMMELMPLLR
ncbi:tRNA (adenosine(37)-N6)-dimethylallyltransferase MiaA [Lentimicrobium sp. L6]|uniref:tRNA (adenosine(37)-N6)-dimethylallyltransferase MiaA n=1 Tax=Lentimicrobium sp. L6 TaxID=2735916 RepID=UPI001552F88D|nr:tRNA (adenosine(37)-N6)-dimethylallyltransferase MiaA [Lentimicrobium sp. L6]NPD84431.1 tRNA (adenosine(37)-N6)-dimethylallyltransferase MiaA [Lentimicrobium sp. L6]